MPSNGLAVRLLTFLVLPGLLGRLHAAHRACVDRPKQTVFLPLRIWGEAVSGDLAGGTGRHYHNEGIHHKGLKKQSLYQSIQQFYVPV